jgi:hypothetical protein
VLFMTETAQAEGTACRECISLAAELTKAREARDRSRETDLVVLTRRHKAAYHAEELLKARLSEVNARSRGAR